MNNQISFHGTIIDNFRSFQITSRIMTDKTFTWKLNVDLRLNEPPVPDQSFIMAVSYYGQEEMQMPMKFNFKFKNSDGAVIRSQTEIKTDFGVTKQLIRYFRKIEFPSSLLLHFQVDVQYKQDDLTPISVTVSQKMLNLLNSKKHSDFIIRVEGTDIPVHRCILANSSAVFEAMLLSGMSETEIGRVEINSLTLATVREMVKFMYSGLVEQPTVPLALDLLRASDIYDLYDLQGWCYQYLQELLDWNNVLEVLVSAHDFNNSKLKDACLKFLIINKQLIDLTTEDHFQEELKERCDLAIELLLKMWE